MSNELMGNASEKARALIEEGKRDAVAGFMKIGAGFSLVVEHKLHRIEGLTLAQYIAGTGMSWGKAHQAIRVFKQFGHLECKGIFHSRLITLTYIKMDGEERESAVNSARVLGPRDFERYVAEKKGKPIPDICPHDKTITICEQCRARLVQD